ncbi:type II toxin-antitoxin system HigB family toxin [Cylindrospermum sp. FACHB-282]|uniref:type II toxin-antitoxin system HigB family toxin n=1 Tax=Cylindrospermum sp. FACHB-282 TaxID=2692794 RepID=UPI0016833DCE|nr:type II toxin-antitoxin system HigB family toxin [Cylindrospermum sp. FACHB-282]MBD2386748.1 type II toxin-antitoxin system HigB family toxin [Cylindrospermum sp. FACHB-282]
MKIISETRFKEFSSKYPDAKANLLTWYKRAKLAKWQNFNEVCQNFKQRSVDKVDNFIIFDICGTDYRLITSIDFIGKKVYLKYFLTHTNYSKDKWKDD